MSGYVQSNQIVVLPYAATTVQSADTGKILMTPQTAGAVAVTYTLPAAAAGLCYKFINGAAGALNGSVNITAPGANTLIGNVITGPTGGVALLAVNGNTTIRFLTAVSLIGDFIELLSDGTNYYVNAQSRVAGAITIT